MRFARRARGQTPLLVLMAAAGIACQSPHPSTPPDPPVSDPTPTPHAPPPTSAERGFPPRPEGEAARTLADVEARLSSGHLVAAITYLEALGAADALEEDAAMMLAHAYVLDGTPTRAIALLETCCQRQPLAARRRVDLLAGLGELAKAERAVLAARARWPADLGLMGAQLSLHMEAGRAHQAETQALIDVMYDAYAQGLATDGQALFAVARAALATRTNDGFHDANAVLEEALQSGGPHDRWFEEELALTHAEIFAEKYAMEESSERVRELLARNPWHLAARGHLAMAAIAAGDLASADAEASNLRAISDRDPGAHLVLAWRDAVAGEVSLARAHLADAIPQTRTQRSVHAAVAAALDIYTGADPATRTRSLLSDGVDPTGWDVIPRLADLLAHLHLYPELEQSLSVALQNDPNNPYAQSARGLNLLRLGREDEGLEALELAWRGDAFNARTFNTRALYREVIGPDYTMETRDGVTLRLPAGVDPSTRAHLLAEIVTARARLDARYQTRLPALTVEIYGTPEHFSTRTVGVPNFGALGVCFGDLVTMVGPFEARFNIARVMWHELAHSYALQQSERRVPRWFTEGLSEWEAGAVDAAWRPRVAQTIATGHLERRLVPLADLERAFLTAQTSRDMALAYAQATIAVEFLMEREPSLDVSALLSSFATGDAAVETIARHLNLTPENLETAYARWRQQRYTVDATDWRPRASTATTDPRPQHWRDAQRECGARRWKPCHAALDALEADDGSGYALDTLRAAALIAQARYDAADGALASADARAGERSEHLKLEVRAATQRGDLMRERAALARLWNLDPDSLEVASRVALFALLLDAPASLAPALRRMRNIAPRHPATRAIQAFTHAARGDRSGAEHLLDLATRADPDDPDTWIAMSVAARSLGDKRRADELLEAALAHPRCSPTSRLALTQRQRASASP